MSRTNSSSFITFSTAAKALGAATESRFLEAADPEDMEAKFAALLAEYLQRNTDDSKNNAWVVTHLHLAGAGDGHTFVLTSEWANPSDPDNPVSASGGDPDLLAMFFFMAATQAALPQYRALAQQRLAALFDPPVSATGVAELQTVWAGASQGTSFMGGVLAFLAFPT